MTLSELLQKVLRRLGQWHSFTLTGGSTTTAINTLLGARYIDDQYKGGTLIVARTTDELAPQNQWSTLTAYDAEANEFTFSPAITATLESGDRVAIIPTIFELTWLIDLCNDGLKALGEVPYIDSTITSIASTRTYDIPITSKHTQPRRIEFVSGTERYDLKNWYIAPSAPGTAGTLVFEQEPPSGTLYLWVYVPHPTLSDYNDYICEYISDELAAVAAARAVVRSYVAKIGGSEESWVNLKNDLEDDFIRASNLYPIWKPATKTSHLAISDVASRVAVKGGY